LASLAQAWLRAGATSFGIWEDDLPLMVWPAEQLPREGGLVASIHVGGENAGELRVAGTEEPGAQVRLKADAGLVAQLIRLEDELQRMTEALIDRQDEQLALYDLTQSMRSQLHIDDALGVLARQAARLIPTQNTFAVFVPPAGLPKVVAYPAPFIEATTLLDLFECVRASGRELVLDTDDGAGLLATSIDNLLLVPIEIRGTVLAALGLLGRPGGFTAPDRKLVRAIAGQAGAQIENVVLHQESVEQVKLQTEMDLARHVQVRLLPRVLPYVSGLDIFASSRPALQVGGDFYDFVWQPGRPFVFAVGDVTGKGLSSALVMAMTRTVIRGKASSLPPCAPDVVMRQANEDLYDDFTEVGMFATVFVGQYRAEGRELLYANSGHSPVIFCPANGSARLLEADDTAMGVLPVSISTVQRLQFDPGDMLVVATDGFSEAISVTGELLGYDRLLQVVEARRAASADEIGAALFDAVGAFADGHPQADDQTLVVIKGVAA
jgi:sigma-B regulation protein RsbU (phosphoserine phosphatase)